MVEMVLKSVGEEIELNEEVMDSIMQMIDENHDGKISKEELFHTVLKFLDRE